MSQSLINTLIANVIDDIYENGEKLITGPVLQENLVEVINTLWGIMSDPDDYLLNQFPPYDSATTYQGGQDIIVSHNGKLWVFASATNQIGVTPGTNGLVWTPVSALSLAHSRNQDTHLDQGGTFEISAQAIVEFINGLTNITAPTLTSVLEGGNTTGSFDIVMSAAQKLNFSAKANNSEMISLPGESKVQHIQNGSLSLFLPVLALLKTTGEVKLVMNDDGSLEVGSTDVDGSIVLWDASSDKKYTIQPPDITDDRTEQKPDGSIDWRGGSVGDVMTRDANGNYSPAPAPGAGAGGQVNTVQAGAGVVVDNTSAANPIVALAAPVFALLVKADQAHGWGDHAAAGYLTKATSKKPITIVCGGVDADMEVATAVGRYRLPFNYTITEILADVDEAPTGSGMTIDIKKNGVSILSTLLTIDDGEKDSAVAATPPVISTATGLKRDEYTIDITAVGSTTAGKWLQVTLIGNETP